MDTISGNSIFDKLDTRMKEVNSLVCVGLDPDISKIPTSVIENNISDSAALYAFLTKIIDITAPHACSYKIQKAFYDRISILIIRRFQLLLIVKLVIRTIL
jgi:orotidine-5'-phosphate decarboxylase